MRENEPEKSFPPNTVHVIRTAEQIHVMLSQMADQKANILLAATFVIFTIAIGQAKGAADPLPLLILGGAAFASAIVAILAVLPATRYKMRGKPNLLFFGNFAQMSEAEYLDRIIETVRSEEGAYRMMARDLYQNGVVLERKKYRLLGYAYRIFLIGLVASGIAFVAGYFV